MRELTFDECREILTRASVGRLGCAQDNQPYVVPVYFSYEPDYAYVFSTFGQKIKWMRLNPKVCLQADEVASEQGWSSVVAYGHYQELREPQYEEELAHGRQLLERRHSWWLNALAERQMKRHNELIPPLFFRIHVDSLTGLTTTGEKATAMEG
jgi:uncharacterized protein